MPQQIANYEISCQNWSECVTRFYVWCNWGTYEDVTQSKAPLLKKWCNWEGSLGPVMSADVHSVIVPTRTQRANHQRDEHMGARLCLLLYNGLSTSGFSRAGGTGVSMECGS